MESINYETVRRYFDKTANKATAAASYLAHDHELPESVVKYRFAKESQALEAWLQAVPASARVLDVGCGAGAWTTVFARRFAKVIGVEASESMASAARERTKELANVEIVQADARAPLPSGTFQLVFLGGLCMYLEDADAIDLLKRIRSQMSDNGVVILRESTTGNRFAASGDYGALYRTVNDYQVLFAQAGLPSIETRRNWGYTAMEIAIELTNLRRRWLPFLPRNSARLGAVTWGVLRAVAPVSFGLLPRVLDRARLPWPNLQNHFFRLQASELSTVQG